MESNLKWGMQVHKTLRLMQVKGNTILIIRHSERPEIKTLLNESEIEITPEGRSAAIKLGEEIKNGHKNACFQVFSWGSLRVVQTAQAIAEGLSKHDDSRVDPVVAMFQSPIKSLSDYKKAFASGKWSEFIHDWLEDLPQIAMLSIPVYSKMILGQVLKEPFLVSDRISILVTHDLHIMPLIKFMFPPFNAWLNYLDGLAISLTDDIVTAGFAEKIMTYPKQNLLPNT